jgi:dolichyl-phosphate-mannose-protein mannosyltransferase
MKTVPLPAEDEGFAPLTSRQILGGRYFWLLLLYSILLLLATGTIAAKRHLWWDEIQVYNIARLPSFQAILRPLNSGMDWGSPTYYLPLFYLVKWFGASSFVLRSIAIFPYWAATLVVYFIVARRTTPLHGFLAMLFPSLTLAFNYSFEARPYALVLLFTACAFLSWQLAQEKRSRRFALPALAVSLAAAFAVHYNACLAALPLLAGEALLAVRRRAFDFPVLLCICCGAVPAVFLLPNILAHKNYVVIPLSSSLFERLSSAYYSLFSRLELLSFVILAVLAVWFFLTRKDDRDRRVLVRDFEALTLAVAGMFLLVPVAYCAIAYFNQTYYPRYVLETVIGAAIFLAIAVHSLRRVLPHLASVLLAVFIGLAIYVAGVRLRTPNETEWGTFAQYSELLDRNTKAVYDSKDRLLLGQAAYLVVLRYGDADLRDRTFHPISESLAISDWMSYKALERLMPNQVHVLDYDSFKRERHRVLMYDPDAWLLNQLVADGEDVKIQAMLTHGPLYTVVLK